MSSPISRPSSGGNGTVEDRIVFRGWFGSFDAMYGAAVEVSDWLTTHVLITNALGNTLTIQNFTKQQMLESQASFSFL
jgi:hypothetical protein